jgi:hypothetical protein
MQHYTNKNPKYQCEDIVPQRKDTALMVKHMRYVLHLCIWKVELVIEIYYHLVYVSDDFVCNEFSV